MRSPTSSHLSPTCRCCRWYSHFGAAGAGAYKGNTIKVEKLSKSGKYAYGMVYGHVNRHAWVDASILQAK
jgi:hypothetical protein